MEWVLYIADETSSISALTYVVHIVNRVHEPHGPLGSTACRSTQPRLDIDKPFDRDDPYRQVPSVSAALPEK